LWHLALVNLYLARDTQGTIDDAGRLWMNLAACVFPCTIFPVPIAGEEVDSTGRKGDQSVKTPS